MPTRLLLEGSDLQALLAQVRTEHGPAAKIVAADRIRNTGLMGVFAKQRYELTVEIPDPTGPAALTAGPAAEETSVGTGRKPGNPAAHFKAGLPSAAIAYQAGLATAASEGIPGAAGPVDGVPAGAADGRPHPKVTVTPADQPVAADSTSPIVLSGGSGGSPADALLALIEEQERGDARPVSPAGPRPVPPIAGTRPVSPAPANGASHPVSPEAAAFADVLSGFGIPGWSTDEVPDTPEALLAAINAAPEPSGGLPRRPPWRRPWRPPPVPSRSPLLIPPPGPSRTPPLGPPPGPPFRPPTNR